MLIDIALVDVPQSFVTTAHKYSETQQSKIWVLMKEQIDSRWTPTTIRIYTVADTVSHNDHPQSPQNTAC